jgi:hypothetical protein
MLWVPTHPYVMLMLLAMSITYGGLERLDIVLCGSFVHAIYFFEVRFVFYE